MVKIFLAIAFFLAAAPCAAQRASIQIFNQPDVEEEGQLEAADPSFVDLSPGVETPAPEVEEAGDSMPPALANPFLLRRPLWASREMTVARFARNPHTVGECESGAFYAFPGIPGDVARRRETFFPQMARIACEAGIPIKLFDALIVQESGYNPFIVSRAGARGLAQLMPDTARGLGVTNTFDPIENMRGGARYLRQQLDRFGSWTLALGAYNAGPGRIEQYGGLPPFRETQDYVRRITVHVNRLTDLGVGRPILARVEPLRRARLLGFRGAVGQTSRNTLAPSVQMNAPAINTITGVPLK